MIAIVRLGIAAENRGTFSRLRWHWYHRPFTQWFPEHEVGILVNHRLPKSSMTQRYVGRHAMLMARLREVQKTVSAALTAAINDA